MIENEKLVKIVGADNVNDEQSTLEEFSRDMSFVNSIRPVCVAKPKNSGAIQKIVKLANETLTPLLPVTGDSMTLRTRQSSTLPPAFQ